MNTRLWWKGLGAVGAGVLLGTGCATKGGTLARGSVHVRATQAVLEADRSAGGDCSRRRVVSTEVVESPVIVVAPARASSIGVPGDYNTMYPLGFGSVAGGANSRHVERWTVDRCGTSARYQVTFGPDGSGGTTVSVKPE